MARIRPDIHKPAFFLQFALVVRKTRIRKQAFFKTGEKDDPKSSRLYGKVVKFVLHFVVHRRR
jgi:hypothetical protein